MHGLDGTGPHFHPDCREMGLVGVWTLIFWWLPYKRVVPKNGWFIMENPIGMDDDWGYPHFRKPPSHLAFALLWCVSFVHTFLWIEVGPKIAVRYVDWFINSISYRYTYHTH